MFKVEIYGNPSLSEKVLVMPAVSVGNTGTLALDLLLNNNSYEKIGVIYTSSFLPIIGPSALDHDQDLATPLELYAHNNHIVLQIRSLCTNSKLFIEKLADWANSVQISSVLLLGSNIDELKPTPDSPDPFCLVNSQFGEGLLVPKVDFKQFKEFFLGGAGLTKAFIESKKIKSSAVLVFSMDVPADIQSALRLAQTTAEIFNLSQNFNSPRSWQGLLTH